MRKNHHPTILTAWYSRSGQRASKALFAQHIKQISFPRLFCCSRRKRPDTVKKKEGLRIWGRKCPKKKKKRTLPPKLKECCKIVDGEHICFVTGITPADLEKTPFFFPVCPEDEEEEDEDITTTSMVDTEEEEEERPPPPPPELCSKCGTEHYPPYCAIPCKTCFDPHHTSADCPFFDHIPKGAVFDRVDYEIVCGCGNIFNEDKWVCTMCNGRPKLESKYCDICDSHHVHHSSHECPVDKESAAEFKAIRDQALSRKKIFLYQPLD